MAKCDICPNAVLGNHKYCPDCAHNVQFYYDSVERVEVLKRIRRADGFFCEYSGARLNMKDETDPFHVQFDHKLPGVPKFLAGCGAIINQSKSETTWLEFPYVVHETVNHWDNGEPFNKNVVPFIRWGRGKTLLPATNARLVDMAVGPRLLDAGLRLPKSTDRVCWICKKYAVWDQMRYCRRCRRLLNRKCDSKPVLAPALKGAYIPELDTFLDYHLGVPLELYDFWSPFYLSFDHPVPGMKGKVVVTSMLANLMKADTDEQEWHAYFRMLDCAMQGGKFEQEKLEFKYWTRNSAHQGRKVA